MSQHIARDAMSRMNLRPVAIAAALSNLQADVMYMATADSNKERERFMEFRRPELAAAYGYEGVKQDKPFAFAGGMAIIPVSGSLINRFGSSYSGYVTGYNFIQRQLNLALADDDVKGIIFDINSYGGEAAGCFEISQAIYESRSQKPSLAVIDSNAYSAAYAIASACSRVVITPSGGAGSIGVIAMHVDMSKMLSDFGVKVTFIYSGDHKADGNAYEPLSADVKKDIQTDVDERRADFAGLVAQNRKLDVKKVLGTEARTYSAKDAVALGLIDAIATPSVAAQAFYGELSGSISNPSKEDAMSEKKETVPGAAASEGTTQLSAEQMQQASAKASSDARIAERARIQGITGCEEAKGRESLANHLAMNTEMSVDQAKGVLAAAAPATPAKATTPNLFQAAMNASDHPAVGADGGAGAGEGELTEAQQILRSQSAATGQKHTA